ncbi:CLUMA_CG000391, isoform A [Clunio marinus]|uniref:CLUMA_CG000391, isoform A n=1 Tax=Clunio marinus TaxID=568069 RepID=A0A1J1HFQ3_9DIPT|nr:CLUMA_CG000391, isoform A [Clunio marinus]
MNLRFYLQAKVLHKIPIMLTGNKKLTHSHGGEREKGKRNKCKRETSIKQSLAQLASGGLGNGLFIPFSLLSTSNACG